MLIDTIGKELQAFGVTAENWPRALMRDAYYSPGWAVVDESLVYQGVTLENYTEWLSAIPAATAPVVGQLGSTEELGVVRYVGYDDTCRSWVWYVEDTEAYVPLAPGDVRPLHPVDMLDRAFRAHGHTVRGLARLIIDNKVPGVKYEA
jgi:hypothetical protein